jgi:hypothetical protein
MASAYMTLLEKVDEAISAYIQSLRGSNLQYVDKDGTTKNIPIRKEWEDEILDSSGNPLEITLPYIGVASVAAEERPIETGNYDVEIEVSLRTSGMDTTRAQHKAWAGHLLDMFHSAPLAMAADIETAGALADFTAQYLARAGITREVDTDIDALITTQKLTLYCWAS